MLTLKEQKKAAKTFAQKWANIGDEKQDTQRFWIELLQTVYGIENPADFIRFEQRVKLENVSYIDAMIPATHTMIEQKSLGKSLTATIRQSDGSLLTPLEQAKRYSANLPYSDRPRWIIGCNFAEFQILDMDNPNSTPEIIYLKDLENDFYRLNFIINTKDSHIEKEMEISKTAGELVGKLYDNLLSQYKVNEALSDEYILQNINKLCVRLVFCLYAEDAGLFGSRSLFHDYLTEFKPQHFRKALLELFRILDTPVETRDPFEEEELLAFPYVNGNLFSDIVEIPPFNEGTVSLLLDEACAFDWSKISPTIFGGIFESTLNPDTRRHGGMHYTSIENIHKVIDPLFLDEYKEKFQVAMSEKVLKKKISKLQALQSEIANLTFFDPATGSGNFLTETYLSLRRLENDILRETVTDKSGSGMLGFEEDEFNPIKVSIQQFYGIEINDFAVAVARTAMWIAEAQMFAETEGIINREMDFLPLHSFSNIHEGNALTYDWNSIINPQHLNYIMGNPPFVGASNMTKQQKEQAVAIYGKIKLSNSIDYVGAWYHKAARYIQDTTIKVAFVSTNSITQGEQVSPLWDKMLHEYHITIIFAYKTFRWSSDAKDKAAVHCVIIGFSQNPPSQKRLYSAEGQYTLVPNINPYLMNAPNVLISSRSKPLCAVPKLTKGNQPTDNGNFILSEEERTHLLQIDPSLTPCIRPYIGGRDLLNQDQVRYCLWLDGISPSVYCKNKEIIRRLEAIRDFRLASSAKPTQKSADTPHLFFSRPQKEGLLLVIPRVSSENRRYIPMVLIDKPVIAADSLSIISDGVDLFHFAILISNVHMAWMRLVAGRLESRYRYSGSIVYNTFPWPTLSDEQKSSLRESALMILDARANYPNMTLADLYRDIVMPKDLRNAHRENNRRVMNAYNFDTSMTEDDCVAALMSLYEELTQHPI